MGKRGSSILGGCLIGTLGGLLGIGLGGWIAYSLFSTEMELPKPGNPNVPIWVLMPIYAVASLPVLVGAIAGGIMGFIGGSLLGSVVFYRLHATSADTDVEPAERRSRWVSGAIYGLVGLGLFWAVLSSLTLITGDDKTLGLVFLLWGLMGVASGIMLSKRTPGARALGIVFLLPSVLLFPHGTVLSPLVIYALCCGETTRYISE
jgi:hypothetical protein